MSADVSDASGGTQNVWTFTDSPFTCPWRIEGANDWVAATGGGKPNLAGDPPLVYRGDGHVTITVSPNPSSQRRSTVIQVGERALTISQAGR